MNYDDTIVKTFEFQIKRCTQDNKHHTVVKCAEENQIDDFINDLFVTEVAIADFIDLQ